MIQILICDKVYVTPEMRRKKILYKIYFILSVILVISLLTYYIYAEYDRAKSEQVSQEILNNLHLERIVASNSEEENVKYEDNVIVVVLSDDTEEEINVDELIASTQQQIEQNETNQAAIPQLYKASDGTEYYTIAVIQIPKLGIQYPVLSTWSESLLKNATCKYRGPDEPNTPGNFCIIGHNYRNNSFFSKLDTLQVTDTIQLQDMSGKIVEYIVYDKYVVEPDDLSCTNQNTNGKTEITLITCYNYGKQRTIIKATAVRCCIK